MGYLPPGMALHLKVGTMLQCSKSKKSHLKVPIVICNIREMGEFPFIDTIMIGHQVTAKPTQL